MKTNKLVIMWCIGWTLILFMLGLALALYFEETYAIALVSYTWV